MSYPTDNKPCTRQGHVTHFKVWWP